MELVIQKGHMVDETGERPYFGPCARIELHPMQIGVIATALRMAAAMISDDLKTNADTIWDANDLPMITEAIDQLDEADSQLTAYFAQLQACGF